jgi:adenylylsulfate reductase subunit B
MPSFVIAEKCDGCKGGDKTACMYICPNDLMVLDPNQMKAYNQEPDQCWECFSCVKICPTQAIEVRGYADFVPLGSSIMPMMGTEDVMWTCKFRNGTIKRFKFPIRTTPEGQANAYTELKGQGSRERSAVHGRGRWIRNSAARNGRVMIVVNDRMNASQSRMGDRLGSPCPLRGEERKTRWMKPRF